MRAPTGADRAEGVGFEPTRRDQPPGRFQGGCTSPLCEPSRPLTDIDALDRRVATHVQKIEPDTTFRSLVSATTYSEKGRAGLD